MKRKTTTVRIDKTQHLRLKKHVKPLGLKLEFWLQKAIDEQMQIQSAGK